MLHDVWASLGSIQWSADLVTAISVTASALMFIANTKREQRAARLAEIDGRTRAPMVEYLSEKLEVMSNAALEVRGAVGKFRANRHEIGGSDNDPWGYPNQRSNLARFVFTALMEESDSLDIPEEWPRCDDAYRLWMQRTSILVELAENALRSGYPMYQAISGMRYQLYPMLNTVEKGTNVVSTLENSISNYKRQIEVTEAQVSLISDCIRGIENTDNRPASEILIDMLKHKPFVHEIVSMWGERKSFSNGGASPLDLENKYHHVDYCIRFIVELVRPRDSSFSSQDVLEAFLVRQIKQVYGSFEKSIIDLEKSLDEPILAAAAVLNVLVRDANAWATEDPLKEALNSIKANPQMSQYCPTSATTEGNVD